MRIFICDDDTSISLLLSQYIQGFFKKNKLACPEILCYTSGEELLSDTTEKDIVFLDIEMPGLSGIYTGRKLKQADNNVIIFIITSYMEYLDEAMQFHVFRYLSKPLDKKRVLRNLKDALLLYNSSVKRIPVETKDRIYTIRSSDIISIEAYDSKSVVYTTDGKYMSVDNIQHWAKKLDMPCFFAPHRSFIVNMEHVSDFGHTTISLCNGRFTAYLARRKYTKFKEAYFLYLESTR
ncbi:MAG: LytTR family DNA-binding domain-containing protein [Lachnospiraceae bacterium]